MRVPYDEFDLRWRMFVGSRGVDSSSSTPFRGQHETGMSPRLFPVQCELRRIIFFDIDLVARGCGMKQGDFRNADAFRRALLTWICELWRTIPIEALKFVGGWGERWVCRSADLQCLGFRTEDRRTNVTNSPTTIQPIFIIPEIYELKNSYDVSFITWGIPLFCRNKMTAKGDIKDHKHSFRGMITHEVYRPTDPSSPACIIREVFYRSTITPIAPIVSREILTLRSFGG